MGWPRPQADVWRDTLLRCGVDRQYLDVPADLPLPDSLKAWIQHPDAWAFCLLGKPGRGKTWLAVRALGEFLRAHPRLEPGTHLRFEVAPLWIRKLKAEFGTQEAERRVFERAETADVLVLDDIGAERDTEFNRSALFDLLYARHAADRITLLTSNAASLAALQDALDPRLVSRLSMRRPIVLQGPDYRVASCEGVPAC